MQFNSYIFIMLFMPIFLITYFLSNRISVFLGKAILIAASVIFYVYGGLAVSLTLGISIVINYLFVLLIKRDRTKRTILILAIIANVILLFYYKYLNFVIITINGQFNKEYTVREMMLPLGISFFTFQQVMYLVSVYKEEIKQINFIDYLLYILYFPKLIMGPLVEPKHFIKELNDSNRTIEWENISAGLKIFSYGLFKKMIFADTFGKAVSWGFSNVENATAGDLFLVMLFYTFEIYFDFSGYTDMAVGISKMINISLPMNFDSPYKAYSVRDFWKRWHMSLTGFLTKYIYFPLGGSKCGRVRTYLNILIVFLISGLWHGANWTFILWGMLHGILQILERIFSKAYEKMFDVVKWFYTFFVVNVLWLLFRAESIVQWKTMLYKMFSFENMAISDELIKTFRLPENTFVFEIMHIDALNMSVRGLSMIIFIVTAYLVCLVLENNYRTMKKTNVGNAVIGAVAFVWAFLCLSSESVFVYFNF